MSTPTNGALSHMEIDVHELGDSCDDYCHDDYSDVGIPAGVGVVDRGGVDHVHDMLLGSPQKESVKVMRTLRFKDTETRDLMMSNLNKLRRNRKFCDCILQVGSHEVYAHRAVLASISRYLSSLFNSDLAQSDEGNRYILDNIPPDSYPAFERLVDYCYTFRLVVSQEEAKTVYKTALKLKMMAAAEACSNFLADNLLPSNCIGIRATANVNNDCPLVEKVDRYIESHIMDVVTEEEFIKLAHIQIDILQLEDEQEFSCVGLKRHISAKVLRWLRQSMEELELDLLTEKVHMLRLDNEGTFRDCKDIDDNTVSDIEIVKDYKQMSKKHPTPSKHFSKLRNGPPPQQQPSTATSNPTAATTSAGLNSCNGGGASNSVSIAINGGGGDGSSSRGSRQSSDLEDSDDLDEEEWKVIVSEQTGDHTYIALVSLKDKIVRLTIHQRISACGPNSARSPVTSRPASIVNGDTSAPLASMTAGRSAFGCVALESGACVDIFCCGGYNRSECIKTCEGYKMAANEWLPRRHMMRKRARVEAAVISGCVFVTGGSDGRSELSCAECYDPNTDRWKYIAKMPNKKFFHTVSALDSSLYVLGGGDGGAGLRTCYRLDAKANKWTVIPPLQNGRIQAGSAVIDGSVFVAGGSDMWSPFNTAEVYDPRTNNWMQLCPMNTARRGPGAANVNGKMYVVGGTDGSHSLNTVEIYERETDTWSVGPAMDEARANCGVCVLNGILYVVGGYNGKSFLDTIEYLDPNTNKWTNFSC